MQEWVQLISNVGFPIAVCVIMMIQNNKTLETLNNSINQLCAKVDILIDRKTD